MNKWVLLEHKVYSANSVDIHYDFLIEDEIDCLTWKLLKLPLPDQDPVEIFRQENHRLVWLSREEYELSGNRGLVKRIDHGVQCLKDNKLVDLLKKNQIPLTVCPLSNIKLCVFDKLENHNLKKMLDKGLRVMVNSDDPAYFGGYLNINLVETSKALNLSLEDVKILIKNSFKSSFLGEKSKNIWLSKI